MISRTEFYNRVKNIKEPVYSKSGRASYSGFYLEGPTLYFKRNNTGKDWDLDLDLLYSVYSKNDFIDTATIKRISGRRVNSPSVALLMAVKCIDKEGNRI